MLDLSHEKVPVVRVAALRRDQAQRGIQRGKTPYSYDATPHAEMQKTRIAAGLLYLEAGARIERA